MAGWFLWQASGVTAIRLTDFDHYYTAAERLRNGENIYFDPTAVYRNKEIQTWYIYPPYLAGILSTVVPLGRETVKLIFLGFVVASIFAIDFFLIRLVRRFHKRQSPAEALIHLLVFYPNATLFTLYSLQIDGFLFLLFLILLYQILIREKSLAPCVFYTWGVLIKLWPFPYLISLAAIYGKNIAFPIGITFLAVIISMTPWVGWAPQWHFVSEILKPLLSYTDNYTENQSLSALMLGLSPNSGGGYALLRGLFLIAYIFAVYHTRMRLRRRDPKAIVHNAALFLPVSLLMSPTAWTASHIRLLLPLTAGILLVMETESRKTATLLALFISVFLYLLPREFLGLMPMVSILKNFPLLFVTLIQFVLFFTASFAVDKESVNPERSDVHHALPG